MKTLRRKLSQGLSEKILQMMEETRVVAAVVTKAPKNGTTEEERVQKHGYPYLLIFQPIKYGFGGAGWCLACLEPHRLKIPNSQAAFGHSMVAW